VSDEPRERDEVARASTWSAMLGAWSNRDEPAVIAGSQRWSWREFMNRAASAAAHLEALTSRSGPVPALFTSTSTAFAYVVGGTTVERPLALLAPRLTEHELAPCIDAMSSDVLICEPEFAELANALADRTSVRAVVVDEPGSQEAGPLHFDAPVEATAFVLFTSGTTGTPKAVSYTQGRLAKRVRVNRALCSLTSEAVYATASPFHHIAGFGNYAVALACGAAVVPVPRFSVDAWSQLANVGVTHALTVPTVLEMLLDADALALPDLRVLQYGASPIHPDTLQRTLDAIGNVQLVNIFGQTEGSPVSCLTGGDHLRIARDGRSDLLSSVGRAAPGVELWIDVPDEHGVGEVCGRAEHFFLVADDGSLHTGDLGRLDHDGYLFLVGRRGDKIIRGGENIYPVEVEQVLEQHPGVREAAVIGMPDRRYGEIVKAVVVAVAPDNRPSTEELREFAREHLAGFKVPTEWTFAAELPRNASGKLLRRHLADGGAQSD
jgi:acyl-CoA synthetase (AMP-forming)/AMP-acid ligase II